MEPGARPRAGQQLVPRRLKGKERKLQSLPGYRSHLASSEADITRLLDWFFRVKPLRMAEQKLPNVFADPGIEDFSPRRLHRAARGGRHAIDIHALECDEEVIAIFAGVADGHRFSMMFNTYTMSANSKYSPGLILMRDIIDHYAGQDYRALDLGIGSDDYKRLFCKGRRPIFDSFIPLKPGAARLAAARCPGLNRHQASGEAQIRRLLEMAQNAARRSSARRTQYRHWAKRSRTTSKPPSEPLDVRCARFATLNSSAATTRGPGFNGVRAWYGVLSKSTLGEADRPELAHTARVHLRPSTLRAPRPRAPATVSNSAGRSERRARHSSST
jgi:hypothetical protein